jgi:putative addiction module component (TIGR02574 family)
MQEEKKMSDKMKEAIAATMQLSLEERAQLAGKLLMSLEEPSESEVERLWLDEAERRLDELNSGAVEAVPADEVFRRAISELS